MVLQFSMIKICLNFFPNSSYLFACYETPEWYSLQMHLCRCHNVGPNGTFTGQCPWLLSNSSCSKTLFTGKLCFGRWFILLFFFCVIVQLVDFRFGKKLSGDRTFTICGMADFLAPEIVQGKGHGFPADWYCLQLAEVSWSVIIEF